MYMIFSVVAEPRNSSKAAKSREIHKNMQNTAKFARNLTKYMTKPEFLVTKEKMFVALATVTVAISSPVFSFYYTHHCIYFFCHLVCYVNTLKTPV